MKTSYPKALITGGSRRIGAEIVEYLHTRGFEIFLHYNASIAEATSLKIKLTQNHASPPIHLVQADLSNAEGCRSLSQSILAKTNKLNLLVHNASIFPSNDGLTEEQWVDVFQVNTLAPYQISLGLHPLLAKAQGLIVNITDIHASRPLKGYDVYCMSKAALSMQTLSLARQLAPNVRVCAIAPGAIIWPEGDNTLSVASKDKILSKIPLKRHGSPNDIAKAVYSLWEQQYLTGIELPVDGGRSV